MRAELEHAVAALERLARASAANVTSAVLEEAVEAIQAGRKALATQAPEPRPLCTWQGCCQERAEGAAREAGRTKSWALCRKHAQVYQSRVARRGAVVLWEAYR